MGVSKRPRKNVSFVGFQVSDLAISAKFKLAQHYVISKWCDECS